MGRGKWLIVADGTRQTYMAFSKDLTVVGFAGVIKWTVVKPDEPKDPPKEYRKIGLMDFDFGLFSEECLDINQEGEYKFSFGRLIKKLWPGDYKQQIRNMNEWVKDENERRMKAFYSQSREQRRLVKEVSEHDFWRFIGIILLASVLKKGGSDLWERSTRKHRTFSQSTDLGPTGLNIMPDYRFREIKTAFSFAFDDGSSDPWARIRLLIEGYNNNREANVAASIKKILDESISAYVPRTTKTGGLPTISFILRKPEPLGTEFKVSILIYVYVYISITFICAKDSPTFIYN